MNAARAQQGDLNRAFCRVASIVKRRNNFQKSKNPTAEGKIITRFY
jgi:hypothetical protein